MPTIYSEGYSAIWEMWVQIAEGQSLLLRYRVVLHKGYVSPDLIGDLEWDVRLAGTDLWAVGEPTAAPPNIFRISFTRDCRGKMPYVAGGGDPV